MNQEIEIEGKAPESENQTINEPVQPERKLVKKMLKLKDEHSPMKRGIKFKFEGVPFEVYDIRSRGRAAIRMLPVSVMVDEQTGEAVSHG